MSDDVLITMSDSARDFQNLVWPFLIHLGWFKGELIPVEATSTKEWAKQLDMLAGIDAWHIKDSGGLTSIGSRVQWRPTYLKDDNRYPYNTFNIRISRASGADTEYKKRHQAIYSDGELLYPYWTCHAYLENKIVGPVLSVGLIKTKNHVEAVAKGWGFDKTNPDDETRFRCVYFLDLHIKGVPLQVYPPSIIKQGMLTMSQALQNPLEKNRKEIE